mgnify:FL=1
MSLTMYTEDWYNLEFIYYSEDEDGNIVEDTEVTLQSCVEDEYMTGTMTCKFKLGYYEDPLWATSKWQAAVGFKSGAGDIGLIAARTKFIWS